MFRLPFAAGRVFSISMLDTLLYQVSTHLPQNNLRKLSSASGERMCFISAEKEMPLKKQSSIAIIKHECPLVFNY